jgi:hypothetical protein
MTFNFMNQANTAIVILTVMVVLQWIVLQAFILNYYRFRKSLSEESADGIRMSLLEKVSNQQARKVENLSSEIDDIKTAPFVASAKDRVASTTKGAALKKKIENLSSAAKTIN